ncbi:MAG: alternate-type signal peptide domain-containing protein [Marmoricola sp.]
MKKSTKGALAAGTGAVLLLGGAGSLAYWTSTDDVAAQTISTGHLSIDTPDCGSGWALDGAEDAAGQAFDPATQQLVPGDVITETCTTVFHAEGSHLRATLAATAGTNDGLFVGSPALLTLALAPLESSADGSTNWTAVPGTGLTEANDGDTVRLQLTVTFDGSASDPATEDVSSALDAIAITATQVHN